MKFHGRVKARDAGAIGLLGVLAGGLCLVAPGVATATPGGTLFVSTTGTDHGSCRVNACRTIGYALSQATSGATISVSAGTYPEQLVINDENVTIKGTGGTVSIDPTSLPTSDTNPDSSLPEYPIVDVNGGTVNLKKITIDGTGASHQFTDCSADFVGVYYHNATGSVTSSTVQNVYLPLSPNNLFGCQDGNDVLVHSDTAQTSNVSVTSSTLKTYQKNGIFCEDQGTTCSVTDSTITGVGPNQYQAGNGFSAYDVASITATGNAVSNDSYAGAGGDGNQSEALYMGDVGTLSVTDNVVSQSDIGIYLTNDGAGPTPGTWTVSGNTVSAATDNIPGGEFAYGDGIQVDGVTNPVTISGNTVTASAENGISLLSSSNVTLSDNQSNKNDENGIYVGAPGVSATGPSTGNTITGNTVKKNVNDGVLADTSSSSNVFTSNVGTTNVNGFDFQDLGTGNTWTGNTCTPAHDSSPSGLC